MTRPRTVLLTFLCAWGGMHGANGTQTDVSDFTFDSPKAVAAAKVRVPSLLKALGENIRPNASAIDYEHPFTRGVYSIDCAKKRRKVVLVSFSIASTHDSVLVYLAAIKSRFRFLRSHVSHLTTDQTLADLRVNNFDLWCCDCPGDE